MTKQIIKEQQNYWGCVLYKYLKNELFKNFLLNSKNIEFFHEYKYDCVHDPNIDENIYVLFGASKGVFISDNSEWVLKTPLYKNNFCAKEVSYYRAAQKHGIEYFFAPCFYLFNFCGRPFYIMKKIYCDDEVVSEDLYNKTLEKMGEDEAQRLFEGDVCSGEEVVNELLEYYYPKNELTKFYDFCNKYGINDIHDSNIGYGDNDMLVCIDYSGY